MPDRAETAVESPLRERTARLEWRVDGVEARLHEGAETFDSLRKSIVAVAEGAKPPPTPTWKIVSWGTGMLVLVVAWVWAAAKYPDRQEFDAAQRIQSGQARDLDDALDIVRARQMELAAEQRLLSEAVRRLEASQKTMDTKLDKLLTPARSIRRTR